MRSSSGATPPETRITRIRVSMVQGRFHKFVAMNAYDPAPKGHTYENPLIRIETAEGVEGVGPGTYATPDAAYLESLRPLIGADPMQLYRIEDGRVTGRDPRYAALLRRHKHLDGALFDLIGKLMGRPAWQLLGPAARDRVEAYDGTLYFSDVWFRDRGVKAVVEEVEEAAKSGYRGLKLKLGRGLRWMSKDDGVARDIEVVRAARRAVGDGVRIMGDPNNGYRGDAERLWKLLTAAQKESLYWIEEPFPENVAQYGALQQRMREAGIGIRIADGENFREPEEFDPYLRPRRVMDILQLDIRTGGLLANQQLARAGGAAGAVTIPHNWGARLGLLMGLHLAKAVPEVELAEDDRSTYDVVQSEGYTFRNGAYTVPDAPGLGVRIDEREYERKCKAGERVVS
jgi:L-alanine-DL-glutamate epimerase-like enolase superfamily enzyme